jgi:HSP20 family molecular chaperone IbpA
MRPRCDYDASASNQPFESIHPSQRNGEIVIYVVKSQSFLRTPLISLIVEGEDWLVGFDEIFETMPTDSVLEFAGFITYPASRLIAHDGNGYQIQIKLEGFAESTPRVKVSDGCVVVTGNKTEYAQEQNQNYLQRGISAHGFRRSFQLGRDSKVTGSNLHQGILQIEIAQAVPSEMEPVADWVRAG